MAEGAVVQFLLENLKSLIQGEIRLIMGVDKELKKLSSTLTSIQAVLEDAEDKQFTSKAINDWLCKLNGVTPEIEDILDEFATQVAKLKYLNKNKVIRCLKNILYRRKIGRRIQDVTDELNGIAAERANLHLIESTTDAEVNIAPNRETCSIIDESHPIYGREKDKETIVDILLNQFKDHRELSILPIIGVGGLGKTTLAQQVFNDSRVVEHFDIKLWVCVSDDFDSKTLIKAILESASGNANASDVMRLDTLQRQLLQLLSHKKYLLVLDDVWNEDPEKWSLLKSYLSCGSSGSSVVVTTRLQIVVDIMSTFPAHHLTGLSKDDCWSLIKQRAFGPEEEKHQNLEAIGKHIAKKCGGVPLAAKALGGLLRYKRTEREWIHVKESEIWNLPQIENSILPALRLSYNHLPLRLRQCFAYCAVFPKDSEIEKEELILRWIAHGYISSTGALEAEDLGHQIWNELVLRCLFQDVRERKNHEDEDEIIFSVHDLVHDLAQSILENKVLGTDHEKISNRSASNTKIREVNLRSNTIAFPTKILLNMNLSFVLTNFSRLRILNASRKTITDVPSLVGKLTHVRYLNFSNSTIRSLPDAICSLWNLKTLKLNNCKKLSSLPKNMRYMRNLRHLFLEGCDSLSEMPPKISELTSLKTLTLFIVDLDRSNELKDLQLLDLGGKLRIDHLERVKIHEDATKANLVEKQKLRHLELVWKGDVDLKSGDQNVEENVLEALQPHQNLISLAIDGYRGNNFPIWMRNPTTLVNIVEMKIIKCPNCVRLPQVLGELLHLKKLALKELKLQYIIDDEHGDVMPKFQRLERLELYKLPNLRGLLKDSVEEMFPNLQHLKVQFCPLLILPKLSSLRKLMLNDCSNATISSVSNFDAITTLWLVFGKKLTCVSKHTLGKLTNLKTLHLFKAQEDCFPEGGLDFLKSLQRLFLRKSPKLHCFPRVWIPQLTTVKILVIEDCLEFIEFPEEIKYLNNIEYLYLYTLPKLRVKSIQHLISLQSLVLTDLPQLTLSSSNWLSSLKSLVLLGIASCPNLTSIPVIIKEMRNLESLYFWRCPELERRCVKEQGEDWHKVGAKDDGGEDNEFKGFSELEIMEGQTSFVPADLDLVQSSY